MSGKRAGGEDRTEGHSELQRPGAGRAGKPVTWPSSLERDPIQGACSVLVPPIFGPIAGPNACTRNHPGLIPRDVTRHPRLPLSRPAGIGPVPPARSPAARDRRGLRTRPLLALCRRFSYSPSPSPYLLAVSATLSARSPAAPTVARGHDDLTTARRPSSHTTHPGTRARLRSCRVQVDEAGTEAFSRAHPTFCALTGGNGYTQSGWRTTPVYSW